jgi:hypothetical protein
MNLNNAKGACAPRTKQQLVYHVQASRDRDGPSIEHIATHPDEAEPADLRADAA